MSGQVVPSAGFPRPRRPIAAPRGKAWRRRTPAQPPTRACGGRAVAGMWDRCVETRAGRSWLCGLISLYTAECNFSDVRLPHKPYCTWGSQMSGIHRNRPMYEKKNSFQEPRTPHFSRCRRPRRPYPLRKDPPISVKARNLLICNELSGKCKFQIVVKYLHSSWPNIYAFTASPKARRDLLLQVP